MMNMNVLVVCFFILLFVCLCIVVLYWLVKTSRNLSTGFDALNQNAQSKNNEILLKQQETVTTVNNIQENYRVMLEQVQKLSLSNVSSSQVISDISSRIVSMNDIMVNKKSRGNWGEYQLNTLLSIYAGENQEIFETQYSLKNGTIGDVALHLPGNEQVMVIDSKFPLENYQNLIQENISGIEFDKFVALFKTNIKKHINDISKKYITAETTDNAVMFIPSEAIYVYICSEQPELIEYAHRRHILMTSPTTLLGVIFTLVNTTKDFNRSKHIKEIEKNIISLADDANRLVERIEKSQSYLLQLTKSISDTKISGDKISSQITRICNGHDFENEKDIA